MFVITENIMKHPVLDTDYPGTWCHVPKEWSPQPHHHADLKVFRFEILMSLTEN